MPDFDAPSVFVMIITSLVGLLYVRYGKRMTLVRFIAFGIMLMTYSYVTPGFGWTLGVGILLAAGPFLPIY